MPRMTVVPLAGVVRPGSLPFLSPASNRTQGDRAKFTFAPKGCQRGYERNTAKNKGFFRDAKQEKIYQKLMAKLDNYKNELDFTIL